MHNSVELFLCSFNFASRNPAKFQVCFSEFQGCSSTRKIYKITRRSQNDNGESNGGKCGPQARKEKFGLAKTKFSLIPFAEDVESSTQKSSSVFDFGDCTGGSDAAKEATWPDKRAM